MRALALILPLLACGPHPGPDAYLCDGGLGVSVARGAHAADLALSTGERTRLPRRPAMSGARYVGRDVAWHERGDAALIDRKGVADLCRLVRRG